MTVCRKHLDQWFSSLAAHWNPLRTFKNTDVWCHSQGVCWNWSQIWSGHLGKGGAVFVFLCSFPSDSKMQLTRLKTNNRLGQWFSKHGLWIRVQCFNKHFRNSDTHQVGVSLAQTLTVLHLISPCMWVRQEKNKSYPSGYFPAHHLLYYTSQFQGHLEQWKSTKGRKPRQLVHKYHSHFQSIWGCVRLGMGHVS